MKNILTLILFLNISNVTLAQTPVTDTIGYLRDSIEAKKTYYIGKPLSVLLNDLKIEVKSYMAIVPFDSEPNIIQFKVTSLDFYSNDVLLTRSYYHITSPHIDITFTPTIQIPKEKFKPGNVLDWTTGWTPEKAAFFGPYTISDLKVRGL